MRCLSEGGALLEDGAYFGMIVKWCGAYLKHGATKRKCGKAQDAQYN